MSSLDYQDDHSLVVLPECASIFGTGGKAMLAAAETLDNGEVQTAFAELAKDKGVYLVAGSMPIKAETGKYYAASLVFSPQGKRLSQYNKIHLFDVDVEDRTKSYRESKYTQAGSKVEVLDLGWCKLGQSICYDVRFTRLYAAMNFPQIIVVPSAFTKVTGEAHWHALLRARAIENQSYVVAANQWGKHDDDRETFGHSCIYSPWGELLSVKESGEGFASAKFDQQVIDKIRRSMPVSQHSLDNYE